MRLLKSSDDGRYSLERFQKDKIPQRYAIHSHTWGQGEDTGVTYKDIIDGTGNNKPGFSRTWNSTANRQSMTICTTSGSTLVVSISRIITSSRQLSIPCFDGMKMQSGAMSICWTCRSTREIGLNTWI